MPSLAGIGLIKRRLDKIGIMINPLDGFVLSARLSPGQFKDSLHKRMKFISR